MSVQAWVVRVLVMAVAVSGVGLAGGALPAAAFSPGATGPGRWAAVACPDNSQRTTTTPVSLSRKDAGWQTANSQWECVANFEAHENRGRLHQLLNQKAEQRGAIYSYGEGIAEYVAQARLIVQEGSKVGGGVTHVTGGLTVNGVIPTIQWETATPTGNGRLDVMRYDPAGSTGLVQVVEVKNAWIGTAPEALTQAQTYVDAFRAAGSSHPTELWNLTRMFLEVGGLSFGRRS